MDFLERLWNISPDGGSGLTELLFLLVLAALVIMGIFCFAPGKTQNRLARECPKAAIQRDGSFRGSFGPFWRRPMVDDEMLAGGELIGVWYGGVPVGTAPLPCQTHGPCADFD